MSPIPDFFQLEKYNISPAHVTQMVFHCEPRAIHPDVIFMPWWQPEVFELWADRITILSKGILFELEAGGKTFSVIRSGIGAPQAGDAALALGCTACRRILFAGSVGGLVPQMQIGDLMVPTVSLSGDGFCRYLEPDFPAPDTFLQPIEPDPALTQAIYAAAQNRCLPNGPGLHTGPVFCIDSILSQFFRLENIARDHGCIGIEMESAAVFKASRMLGIQAAALFSVSDVPIRGQTLYAGRSDEEKQHRKETRRQVLARAILDVLCE